MRFVVDESSWDFTGHANDAIQLALEAFLERLSTAREREEAVTKSRTIFEQKDACRALNGNDDLTRERRDLRVRLKTGLDRLTDWDDTEDPWPDNVVIAGTVLPLAPSIAWAHASTRCGKATACLPLFLANRHGALAVVVAEATIPVWFVNNETEHVRFGRDAIVVEDADEDGFAQLAASAFPNLRFVDGLWGGLGNLSRPYRDVRADVILHLGVLSDHGKEIFKGPRGEIAGRFGGHGVEISPENGKVLSNNDCMKARTREYAGKQLEFVWHTKLLHHIDRIHIHQGNADSGNCIIVGIFRDHLMLPGE